MATLRDLLEQKDQLRDLEGWRVLKSLQDLRRSIDVFEGNARELLELMGEYRKNHGTPATFDLTRPESFDRYLDETQRLLHNYLAAAESIRNHVLRVQRNHVPEVRQDADTAEFVRRYEEVFQDELGQVGRELRHLFLKDLIPQTDAYLAWGADPADRKADIRLVRSALLAERNWNKKARAYIDNAGDDILVNEFVVDHRQRIVDFYEWFRGAVLRRNQAAIAELEARSMDVAKGFEDAWGPPPVSYPSDEP
jgi:hypothetical protein